MDPLKSFTPFFDRLVVERKAAKPKAKIVAPSVIEAVVLATGPGIRTENGDTIPMQVQVGDRVLLPTVSESKIVIENKEYHVYREAAVIGKFN